MLITVREAFKQAGNLHDANPAEAVEASDGIAPVDIVSAIVSAVVSAIASVSTVVAAITPTTTAISTIVAAVASTTALTTTPALTTPWGRSSLGRLDGVDWSRKGQSMKS
jgi:hypothetical protein